MEDRSRYYRDWVNKWGDTLSIGDEVEADWLDGINNRGVISEASTVDGNDYPYVNFGNGHYGPWIPHNMKLITSVHRPSTIVEPSEDIYNDLI